MPISYQKSKTGYYKVETCRTHHRGRFPFKPGSHTVNQQILDAMIEDDGLVTAVTPAE